MLSLLRLLPAAPAGVQGAERHAAGAAKKAELGRPTSLTGIDETDETLLCDSQKSSCKLDWPPHRGGGRAARCGMSRDLDCIPVARDCHGNALDAVTGRGTDSPRLENTTCCPCASRRRFW